MKRRTSVFRNRMTADFAGLKTVLLVLAEAGKDVAGRMNPVAVAPEDLPIPSELPHSTVEPAATEPPETNCG